MIAGVRRCSAGGHLGSPSSVSWRQWVRSGGQVACRSRLTGFASSIAWLQPPGQRDHSGFLLDRQVEKSVGLVVKEFRASLAKTLQAKGEFQSASRLLKGGQPGHEELRFFSDSMSEDAQGRVTGHYVLQRSWLPPEWDQQFRASKEALLARPKKTCAFARNMVLPAGSLDG